MGSFLFGSGRKVKQERKLASQQGKQSVRQQRKTVQRLDHPPRMKPISPEIREFFIWVNKKYPKESHYQLNLIYFLGALLFMAALPHAASQMMPQLDGANALDIITANSTALVNQRYAELWCPRVLPLASGNKLPGRKALHFWGKDKVFGTITPEEEQNQGKMQAKIFAMRSIFLQNDLKILYKKIEGLFNTLPELIQKNYVDEIRQAKEFLRATAYIQGFAYIAEKNMIGNCEESALMFVARVQREQHFQGIGETPPVGYLELFSEDPKRSSVHVVAVVGIPLTEITEITEVNAFLKKYQAYICDPWNERTVLSGALVCEEKLSPTKWSGETEVTDAVKQELLQDFYDSRCAKLKYVPLPPHPVFKNKAVKTFFDLVLAELMAITDLQSQKAQIRR
jgi:hypothetical protein